MLAEVVVLAAARGLVAQQRCYTYAVPRSLTAKLAPGHLVSVPFGTRLVAGIVWTVEEEPAPVVRSSSPANQGEPAVTHQTRDAGAVRVREIAALLDEAPLVTTQRRALAAWLADRYNCSLAAAVHLLLPLGLVRHMRVVLRPGDTLGADPRAGIMPTAPAEADAERGPVADTLERGPLRDDAALLGALRASGQLDEGALSRVVGARRAGTAVAALLATGAVVRATTAPSALSGPRTQTVLRLIASPETLALWRGAARTELDALLRRAESASPSGAGDMHTYRPQPVGGAAGGRRRAERLLRQLAVLDVLSQRGDATVGAPPGGAPSAPWRLNDLRRLTRITPAALTELETAGLVASETAAAWHDPLAGRAIPRSRPLPLTPAQASALRAMLAPPREDDPHVVLLHGVTGSGKTEVYLQALEAHLAAGRRGIVLVPEIALTPQAMMRYAGRFPGRVALLHSGLSDAERVDEWRRIRAGQVDVVVGSRSALFAPVDRLGLIVVDEEHETAYKQEGWPPTYHARDVAVELGRLAGATVVLGSATPSVESYWEARHGGYRLVELVERVPTRDADTPGTLPPVTVVDLRAELRAGNTSILGTALQAALHATLAAGQQAILFLNRRGTASSVICRDCGYVAACQHCDVPMTFHAGEQALMCHYCGQRQPTLQTCPHCWSTSIRYFGLGTERVESAVRRLYPQARVLRWDRDTARTRQAHEDLLAVFANRQADVLVGTQMIAKGLDLPAVTLVGVISADIALYLPDFRASERAFQLLTQVAGRAGRGAAAGRVIVQTFNPDHFCIQAAARHDYHDFYDAEISARQRYGYPPFRQFVKFTYAHADRYHAQVEAAVLAERLEELIREQQIPETDIVGPAPAFMERLRGHYRWHLIARGPDLRPLLHALTPEDLPRGWSVDVDPASTL
jgi:primosomal protein N' (replication factor Y)